MGSARGNKVALVEDLILEVTCAGVQNEQMIESLIQDSRQLVEQLKKENRPILVLVRLRKVGPVDIGARRVAAGALTKLSYDRIAIYGASRFLQKTTELIIRAVHKEEGIRIFPDGVTARSWLRESALLHPVQKSDPDSLYRAYVAHKLKQLNDIISLAVIGEYSKDIPIPKEEDEFTDVFVGVRVLIETLEEKAEKNRRENNT